MNERFQELAKQAVLQANEVFDQKGKDYMGIVMEKFAELIVKECAKFMDENSGYNDSNGCWFPEPEAMLKHFGFEE